MSRTKSRRGTRDKRAPRGESPRIFDLLRARIADALRADGLEVTASSALEMAIGTFVPSEIVKNAKISDYPFIGARYIARRDGHVYIVAGATDDGQQVLAYRLGFLQSIFTTQGGIAVGITEDGWMGSEMVLFSMEHERFQMQEGKLQGIDSESTTRRTYPFKKFKVYWQYLTARGSGPDRERESKP